MFSSQHIGPSCPHQSNSTRAARPLQKQWLLSQGWSFMMKPTDFCSFAQTTLPGICLYYQQDGQCKNISIRENWRSTKWSLACSLLTTSFSCPWSPLVPISNCFNHQVFYYFLSLLFFLLLLLLWLLLFMCLSPSEYKHRE